jgi:hypothetical protein
MTPKVIATPLISGGKVSVTKAIFTSFGSKKLAKIC